MGTVLAASDRAFDEQRFFSVRWDTIQRIIIGKGTQKKIREVLDTSRQRVIKEDIEQVEYFVRVWVKHFVEILAAATHGYETSEEEDERELELSLREMEDLEMRGLRGPTREQRKHCRVQVFGELLPELKACIKEGGKTKRRRERGEKGCRN